MQIGSIVVMESGADWPTWVDEEAGVMSSVVVLSRQRGETAETFTTRARSRLQALAEHRSPRRGVLVCGALQGGEAPSSRERLLRALCEVVCSAGGDEVVLIGEDARLIRRLTGYVRELDQRADADGRRFSLRLRAAPLSGERLPAQRVA